MKSTGSKRATLAMMMAMAAQAGKASAMEPMTLTNPYGKGLEYTPPSDSRKGGWYSGLSLTKKQRKARAATKRQRKARQQQRKA